MKGGKMLSRKYYKMIAEIIRDNTFFNNKRTINKDTFINDLCAEFKTDNKLFNTSKFIEACNKDL